MGFRDWFRPRWQHSDYLVAERAVEKTTNTKVLARIARKANSFAVLNAVVEKTEDPKILAEVAKNDHETILLVEKIEAAVKKIEDSEILAEIAKNAALSDVRETAARKIEDPEILAEIAKNDDDASVRGEAFETLGKIGYAFDAEPLIAALKDEDSDVRTGAARGLKWMMSRNVGMGKLLTTGLKAEIARLTYSEYSRHDLNPLGNVTWDCHELS